MPRFYSGIKAMLLIVDNIKNCALADESENKGNRKLIQIQANAFNADEHDAA